MKGRLGKEFSKAADLLVAIMGPSELAASKYDQLALFAKIHAGLLYGENLTIEKAEDAVLEAVKNAETVEQFQSNMGDLYEKYTGARGLKIILSPH